jgi:uroporphyrinogen-III synthase
MQQNKVSILSTRSLIKELINDALAKGINVDVIPFIKIEPIKPVDIQQKIKRTLMPTAAVVFTSMSAVEAVASELEGQRFDCRIFCIGHATRNSVEKYFGNNLVTGTADNAKELADIIVKRGDIKEIVFFCGNQRRNELQDTLQKNNIRINEIVVYQTIPASDKIEKYYHGILFFSPSGVQSFFKKNKLDDKAILFAIGNTTGNEIKKYSKNRVVISDLPSSKDLIEKTIRYFQTHSIQN